MRTRPPINCQATGGADTTQGVTCVPHGCCEDVSPHPGSAERSQAPGRKNTRRWNLSAGFEEAVLQDTDAHLLVRKREGVGQCAVRQLHERVQRKGDPMHCDVEHPLTRVPQMAPRMARQAKWCKRHRHRSDVGVVTEAAVHIDLPFNLGKLPSKICGPIPLLHTQTSAGRAGAGLGACRASVGEMSVSTSRS